MDLFIYWWQTCKEQYFGWLNVVVKFWIEAMVQLMILSIIIVGDGDCGGEAPEFCGSIRVCHTCNVSIMAFWFSICLSVVMLYRLYFSFSNEPNLMMIDLVFAHHHLRKNSLKLSQFLKKIDLNSFLFFNLIFLFFFQSSNDFGLN